MKIIVVGAGINGVVAAVELRKRGHHVVLIDPGPLPHPLAASTDVSKVVRATYGADEEYTELAERSREAWRQWNVEFGAELYHEVGFLCMRQRPMQPGIGPGGLQAMLMADLPDPGLARVAQETGGGYTEIRFGQDLGAAFARVADELHGQYLIGFAPPKRDGKVHNIEVRVNERGFKPRARKSYVAPR